MTDDSFELAERARRGDNDALRELLDRHLPGLRAYVRLHSGPLLRSKEESSDLVQTVCLEVLRNAERFEHPAESGFRRWLYVTALRKIKNRHRYYLAEKRDAVRERAIEAGSGDRLLDLYASFSTPSREVSAREEVERVEAAFDLLSEEHREVILLARVVGLSRAEIGERMGRSEGGVRILLYRALARLTELLDEGHA